MWALRRRAAFATRSLPILPVRAFHASALRLNNIKVFVNGTETEIPNGSTVLQACETAGMTIPRFCYHDRLSIAGNCRMCLVEVEKSPKPVASCAMPAMPGMKIFTDTPLVHTAREGVLEFLLSNHPLDCPICDQGGECDLQELSMNYGGDRSRFKEFKRGVEDKNIGPLVKTIMTRCIHCTRCVRFTSEVAGVETMGTTGRGNNMEIGMYTEKLLDTELSGNIIDLCPVGALTSKPYAFKARPWELVTTESIDVTDAVGSNIRVDTRGMDVMRVIPRLHEDVNEEWISDKARFSYDGLNVQRLDQPLAKKNGQLTPVTWREALELAAEKLTSANSNAIQAIVGDQVGAEAMVTLKDFINRLGSDNTSHAQDTSALSADLRSEYLMNSTIAGIEEADALLLVGTNPRMEAPIINARIRKAATRLGLRVASIGPSCDLTYEVEDLGNEGATLGDLASGKHPFSKVLKEANRPMVVVGMGALSKEGGSNVLADLDRLKASVPGLLQPEDYWNGVNFLHTAAARVTAQDIGFVVGGNPSPAQVVYLLGADEEATINSIPKNAFVIYQGHHGDAGASRADVILPGGTHCEQSLTYVNTEGRVQRTYASVDLVGEAREDWKIIRAMSEFCGTPLSYNDVDSVRARLQDIAPHLGQIDEIEYTSFTSNVTGKGKSVGPFKPFLTNFFMTDPITFEFIVFCESTCLYF